MTTLHTARDAANAIAARLSTINVASGSITDIGLRVLRGRRRIDNEQVPCVVLAEGLDQINQASGRVPSCEVQQTYMLIAYHECDPDHPNDRGHDLIKDLKRAIFSDGVTLGGNVLRVEYKGRDIGPRGDGVAIVCASIEIVIKFIENLSEP